MDDSKKSKWDESTIKEAVDAFKEVLNPIFGDDLPDSDITMMVSQSLVNPTEACAHIKECIDHVIRGAVTEFISKRLFNQIPSVKLEMMIINGNPGARIVEHPQYTENFMEILGLFDLVKDQLKSNKIQRVKDFVGMEEIVLEELDFELNKDTKILEGKKPGDTLILTNDMAYSRNTAIKKEKEARAFRKSVAAGPEVPQAKMDVVKDKPVAEESETEAQKLVGDVVVKQDDSKTHRTVLGETEMPEA